MNHGSRYTNFSVSSHLDSNEPINTIGAATVAETVVASYPGDLTTLPGGQTTPGAEHVKTKRKQTLLSLLDALHELTREEELGASSTSLQNTHLLRLMPLRQ